MRLPRLGPRNEARKRSRISVIRWLTLGVLSACTIGSPSPAPITTSSAQNSQESGECSLFGRLACNAMALGSSDGAGTCTRSRTGGTYVEACGTMNAPAQPPQPKPQLATVKLGAARRSSVELSWKDNSNNETGFVIERCEEIFRDARSAQGTTSCRGSWTTIATVGPNVTTYVDNTVTAKQTYLYRVKATNQFGSSAATPEAMITAPVK